MTQSLLQRFESLRPAAPTAGAQLSVEDLDPQHAMPHGAVLIEPNPQNAAEVAQAYSELQAEVDAEDSSDVAATIESLRQLKDDIDTANAAGGLSAESAFFAALSTESLLSRLGIAEEEHTASFESAITNPTGKMLVSTEALTATLEEVDRPYAQIGKKLTATVYRLLTPAWLLVKSSGRGIDELVAQARKIKAKSGAKIRVKTKQITEGKGVSKDVPASLMRAAEILKYLVKDFSKQANEDMKVNARALTVFHKADSLEEIVACYPKILANWKDTRAKLGGNPSDPLIGNYRLFEDHALKYGGNNPALKKFDILANHNFPTLTGWQKDRSDADSDAGMINIPALTPDQVVKVGLALKTAVDNFSAWKAFAEKISAAATTAAVGGAIAFPFVGNLTRAAWLAVVFTKSIQHSVRGDSIYMDDVDTIYDACDTANRLRFHVSYDAGRVLRKIIKLYKQLAKESLKAHATASTEAMDNATASVGDSVNETAPNEPVQAPPMEAQAPPEEVVPHQPSFQDNPESHQNLFGNVQAATESLTPVPYWFRK